MMPFRVLALAFMIFVLAVPATAQSPSRLHFTWPNDEPLCGGFGSALDTTGDIDGDGVTDVIVGSDIGCVRVLSGATGMELHRFLDTTPFSGYGSAVAGAGDVDGDGELDLLIVAPEMVDSAED